MFLASCFDFSTIVNSFTTKTARLRSGQKLPTKLFQQNQKKFIGQQLTFSLLYNFKPFYIQNGTVEAWSTSFYSISSKCRRALTDF